MDQGFLLQKAGPTAEPVGARRIAPDAAARADWHNARAQLLMVLNQQLDAAPDDQARERLITRLAAALRAPPGPGEAAKDAAQALDA